MDEDVSMFLDHDISLRDLNSKQRNDFGAEPKSKYLLISSETIATV